MIRVPLRPLARVLRARADGEDPDRIEAEARAARMRARQRAERLRAERRLFLLAGTFLLAFGVVGGRMAMVAASPPAEAGSGFSHPAIASQRADILDAEGRILATNLATHSLYAQTRDLVDPEAAALGLARIFPDLDADALRKAFSRRKFVWIKLSLSPEQRQAVHDLGEPGLLFGPREIRLYPNGRIAAHILGGTRFGDQGVHAAEIIGTAGVELRFDAFLRDPNAGGRPLQLSIDLSVQAAVESGLAGGRASMNAKAASAVLMEAATGRVVAMASLPDFDPNSRPRITGKAADSPVFNRAAQGVYEVGSSLKIVTAALAMEAGLANPSTMIDTAGPLRIDGFRIRDFHDHGPQLSLRDVIVESSNIGTSHLAVQAGTARQKAFLAALGLTEPVPVELPEARRAAPLLPNPWTKLSTMTVSYGHGLAVTPLHVAAAYASLVNGGRRVQPTLLATPQPLGPRVVSEAVSRDIRRMLRAVVTEGTASLGEVPGYRVGGKTGTADKPNDRGSYHDDKVLATFAAVFPADDPAYVLVVTLDEPVDRTGRKPRRTAGWTAVPVTAEIIRRIAPLMNMAPLPKQGRAP